MASSTSWLATMTSSSSSAQVAASVASSALASGERLLPTLVRTLRVGRSSVALRPGASPDGLESGARDPSAQSVPTATKASARRERGEEGGIMGAPLPEDDAPGLVRSILPRSNGSTTARLDPAAAVRGPRRRGDRRRSKSARDQRGSHCRTPSCPAARRAGCWQAIGGRGRGGRLACRQRGQEGRVPNCGCQSRLNEAQPWGWEGTRQRPIPTAGF